MIRAPEEHRDYSERSGRWSSERVFFSLVPRPSEDEAQVTKQSPIK